MAAPWSFKFSLFLFLLYSPYVVITMANMITASMLCHEHERSALLKFKQSLSLNKSSSYYSSAYPKTESWKARGESSSDCCLWYGVECDDNTGYVIGLHLSSSLLHGTLASNSTIFSLVHLQTLDLADNDFSNSPVPPEITHLSSLFSLNLSMSGFSGQIPLELSRLSKLTSLDLSRNNLHNDFPIDIFHLPKLFVLNVSGNQYLTGYLPEFNRTSSLRELELASTNFSGNVPASVGNLQSLTRLQLGECYFSGSIPASIGNLTQLTYLTLSSNKFDKLGKLSWVDKLTKLTVLRLHDSYLYGDIPPSLANLTQLTFLNLEYNFFTGEIPLSLMNMTHLTTLLLTGNGLRGLIPSSFTQLKNLEILSLSQNNLTGTVESEIFLSLEKLTYLSLSYNKITLLTHHRINSTLPKLQILQLGSCNLREIPYFLQFQNNLEILFLRDNNIGGEIPHWIWNASDHLEAIELSVNFLTAMEHNPVALPGKSLRIVELRDNMLQGNLPVPPPNTIVYSVANNRLTGDLSSMICGVMSLKILDLSNNNMSGLIPRCLGNTLEALILQDNNFSGTIPPTYTKECDLKVMYLSQNQLTGKVPKSLSDCKMLQILDLSNNQIEQSFPIWLGSLPRLQVLLLHSNKFHGVMKSAGIPLGFPMLRIINLSGNSLTGDLPVDYIKIWNAMKVYDPDMQFYMNPDITFVTQSAQWSLSYRGYITLTNKGVKTDYYKILNIFTAIDLSSNKFTGKIPESFGSLEALQLLDLSDNNLTGPIPPSLGNLRQLESLNLAQNKLSGVIPEQLAAQLNFIEFFNVSYNLLRGRIPQGPQFKTFDNNSYMGNSGLCGFPLSKECGTVHSPPADNNDIVHDENEYDRNDDKFPSGFDWIFLLAGLGSGLVVGCVMGNISSDRHPWLIDRIVQKYGGTWKNRRRKRQRQIIGN